MEDLNQTQPQVTMQNPQRPTAVTVFGILSIVFGSMGIVCAPITLLIPSIIPIDMETSSTYKVWQTIGIFGEFGFRICLLILGIGLLKLKRWARRGSIIYACIYIAWSLLGTIMNIAALSLNWIKLPETSEPAEMGGMIGGFIGGICGGIIYSIGYSILLLIFMQTAKVKQAFAQVESGQVLQL